MKYSVEYICRSHVGKNRKINQDNYICVDRCLAPDDEDSKDSSVKGVIREQSAVLGVFDGMGGEACGEVASYIAAKLAADYSWGDSPARKLVAFTTEANGLICEYTKAHHLFSMGTTSAMMLFTSKEISLCNVGDSKIFRFSGGKLEQISVDHVDIAPFGGKPALSQNIGIPETEMHIEPYLASGIYKEQDVYLICSDGLTDMVKTEQIENILKRCDLDEASDQLLDAALYYGGKDNITFILCRIHREKKSFLKKLLLR